MQNNIDIITIWDSLLEAKNTASDVHIKKVLYYVPVIEIKYLLDKFPEELISHFLQEVPFTSTYAYAFKFTVLGMHSQILKSFPTMHS